MLAHGVAEGGGHCFFSFLFWGGLVGGIDKLIASRAV